MENKKIKLRQDRRNISLNRKITIELEEESLYYELKKYFKWRKGDFKERFFNLETKDHDAFIKHLYDIGYTEVE